MKKDKQMSSAKPDLRTRPEATAKPKTADDSPKISKAKVAAEQQTKAIPEATVKPPAETEVKPTPKIMARPETEPEKASEEKKKSSLKAEPEKMVKAKPVAEQKMETIAQPEPISTPKIVLKQATETEPLMEVMQEGDLSAEQINKILIKRAKELAHEPPSDKLEEETLQLLTFSLSNEYYAIQIEAVKEVQPLKELTPVPCTPDFVLGAINLRGNILSVLDIRKFFNVPSQKITPASKIVIIEACGLKVGILVDMVQHIKRRALTELEPPIATLRGIEQEYIKGLTKDMVVVLNINALMNDKRIVIQEEIA